ncbi:hypothetical protein EDD11_007672 [Mortierella claussenii]|nr:hypothetical protein EDD11_007672 [Mortierella claussenii]
MAVVPKPIKECTKSVIITPADSDGCAAFAGRHNVTFEDLLKWNEKLRTDCANLDEGHPICVSVTTGQCCLATTGTPSIPPATSNVGVPSSTVGTGTIPGTAPGTGTATASRTVPVTTVAPTTASVPSPVKTVTSTPPVTTAAPNSATGTKSSMLLAAAGIVISVAYML